MGAVIIFVPPVCRARPAIRKSGDFVYAFPLVPPGPFPLAPEEPTYPKERTVLQLMI